MTEVEDDDDDRGERALPMTFSRLARYRTTVDFVDQLTQLNSLIKHRGSLVMLAVAVLAVHNNEEVPDNFCDQKYLYTAFNYKIDPARIPFPPLKRAVEFMQDKYPEFPMSMPGNAELISYSVKEWLANMKTGLQTKMPAAIKDSIKGHFSVHHPAEENRR